MSRHLCRSKALPMCCGSRETPVICTPLPSRIHWQLEERWSRCVCFEFNLIITLDQYTFNGLSNVQNLILNNNKLKTLISNAFSGLTNLQSLGYKF